MRDYLIREAKLGMTVTVSEAPTPWLQAILRRLANGLPPTGLNPGVTAQSFKERVQLELFIRETGLRD